MERRMHICRLVMILTIGTALCQSMVAQDYVAPAVSISKDKVKIDGKVFYSHIVLEKQTLFSISKAYNVSIEDIYRHNPSVKVNGLRKNDIINIPVVEIQEQKHEPVVEKVVEPQRVAQATHSGEIIHIVKWYEDLASISDKYKVSVESIMKANSLKDQKLRNKQELIIPNGEKQSEPVKTEVAIVTEPEQEKVAEKVVEEVKEIEESTNIEQYSDTLFMTDFWANLMKRKVNAALILPFKATGTSSSKNHMDFYSGALLASKELADNDIELQLNVFDMALGATNLPEYTLKNCDLILGPISPGDITLVNQVIDGNCPIISPLDQRSEALTNKYRNLIQAPSSQYAQFADIANWVKDDLKEGDKIVVISEKGARQNDAGRALKAIIDRNQVTYTPFSYSILEGRDIQPTLEAAMTATGTNRVIIASDSEAFVNDAVRNLNLIVHNKFQVVLYAPAKIRTFETIEVENFHNTSLHASLTYNIDYDDKRVQDFIRRYRAMFNTEPTQFAFQGYDLTKYFVTLAAKYQHDWTSHISNEDTQMLQSNFMFRPNGPGGYVNIGIRRIIYGKDYSIEEAL